jgi:Fic family protein
MPTKEPLSEVDAELHRLAKPLRELYEKAQRELEEARQRRDAAEEKVRRVKKALASVDPAFAPKPKPKPKKKGYWKPGPEIMKDVLVALIEGGERTSEIEEITGHSNAAVNAALKTLREEGKVRLAGRDGNASLYKPMNDKVAADA